MFWRGIAHIGHGFPRHRLPFTAAPPIDCPRGSPTAAPTPTLGRIRKIATLHTQFSPHGLHRRRGSLYYKRTGSLAEVAETAR